MVATNMGPSPKGFTLAVLGDDGRPYRGEAAAPPLGEVEAVRRSVKAGVRDAVEQVLNLATDTPEFLASEPGAYHDVVAAMSQVVERLLNLSATKHRRQEVTECYNRLREMLCQSVLGMPTSWPQGFWETQLGRLLYVSFYEAYGESLLLNQDVAKELDIDLSRVGQVERLGLLPYIENPYVAHRMQRRRRVSPDMVEAYRNRVVA